MTTHLTRRAALGLGLMLGAPALADRRPIQVDWPDLIPPGIAYSEIIGEGEMDYINDRWKPVFDANGTKFNIALEGRYIRMPGFIIPMEFEGMAVTEFILVPYEGACIHVPPPPPNQLVYVRSTVPWETSGLWDVVWVTGVMSARTRDTELAVTGYALEADLIETYRW